jgi:hypothetical protein
MTFPLIKLLGHEIASSNWDPASKLVFWAACCTAFFRSFRLCEILPKSEKTEPEILTWDRVRFTQENSIVLNIKFPKIIRDHAGDFVDIFKIKNCSMCPYSALKNLAKSDPVGVSQNLPVFRFKNGKNLTISIFTRTMMSLLEKHIGSHHKLEISPATHSELAYHQHLKNAQIWPPTTTSWFGAGGPAIRTNLTQC